MVVERFAPSPTGLLHLGHAYSAWLGWKAARAAGGKFFLRLEDLDQSRVRPGFIQAISEDLTWFGIDWDGEILAQSTREAAYRSGLRRLEELGLLYRCTCTRRDAQTAAAAPQEGYTQVHGPDGLVYPGTCRSAQHGTGAPHALRLDMSKAIARLARSGVINEMGCEEIGSGPKGECGHITLSPEELVKGTGDVVLARRDGVAAYHLAVVIDDAYQGVSHVTRGEDLFSATMIHVVLQALLGLPTPTYRHHALVRDETGKRLAKRDDARAIAKYREDGWAPEQVLALAKANARCRY